VKHKPVKASDILAKEKKRTCQRCGDGVYMAQHKQGNKTRYYCGKCHMTIFE
jgi:ribosomal protein S27AE